MQFAETDHQVNEAEGSLSVKVLRSGDLSIPSSVRCYTRQSSAQVMMDYEERPNTDAALVRFEPGTWRHSTSFVYFYHFHDRFIIV